MYTWILVVSCPYLSLAMANSDSTMSRAWVIVEVVREEKGVGDCDAKGRTVSESTSYYTNTCMQHTSHT